MTTQEDQAVNETIEYENNRKEVVFFLRQLVTDFEAQKLQTLLDLKQIAIPQRPFQLTQVSAETLEAQIKQAQDAKLFLQELETND